MARSSDDPLGKLIASAQSALADLPSVHDFRAKEVLTDSARVQATCALAVAVDHLAISVDQLVAVITTQENP